MVVVVVVVHVRVGSQILVLEEVLHMDRLVRVGRHTRGVEISVVGVDM